MSQTPAVPLQTPFDPSTQLVHELHLSKDAEEWLKTISPGMFDNYKEIESTWNHPFTQFTVTLVQDQQLKAAVTHMYAQHAVQTLIGYEALLIVLVWILRAWRLSKAGTWLLKLWTQAWIGMLLWIAGVFLVPFLVWGDSYRIVLSQLAKAFIRHFFA